MEKDLFRQLETGGFEQVIYCHDSKVGLKAIIALHSTALGPATGGVRMWNYASESEALYDVLRLSQGMSFKASVAGLNWGGGKAVIIGDPKGPKNPKMLERFGEFVERLGGQYITAKDVGIGAEDLKVIKRKTQHILGIDGEPGSSGNPSPATAFGVYHGMKACAQHAFKSESLKGLRVALQGLGSVAYSLLDYLTQEGAIVVGCDIDPATVDRAFKKYGIEIVSPEAIYDVKCDIFSPHALGATLNSTTIHRLKAKIIAGAANNQLATPEDGDELHRRGLVYAPDYVINAGGLINIYYENPQKGEYSKSRAYDHIAQIGQTLTALLKRSEEEKMPTYIIADRMAKERIEKASA